MKDRLKRILKQLTSDQREELMEEQELYPPKSWEELTEAEAAELVIKFRTAQKEGVTYQGESIQFKDS
tara:strand:+ start:1267 stop:1470 length:204 start_codon:yes stop_codon:yes gene_type:complete